MKVSATSAILAACCFWTPCLACVLATGRRDGTQTGGKNSPTAAAGEPPWKLAATNLRSTNTGHLADAQPIQAEALAVVKGWNSTPATAPPSRDCAAASAGSSGAAHSRPAYRQRSRASATASSQRPAHSTGGIHNAAEHNRLMAEISARKLQVNDNLAKVGEPPVVGWGERSALGRIIGLPRTS